MSTTRASDRYSALPHEETFAETVFSRRSRSRIGNCSSARSQLSPESFDRVRPDAQYGSRTDIRASRAE